LRTCERRAQLECACVKNEVRRHASRNEDFAALLVPAPFINYGLSNSGLRRRFLLKAHLEAVEQHLLAISRIPTNAGHMLHRGTPREAFVKEFLIGHLSARLAVGSGEIIDASSLPRKQRNQFDIIIYRADYPKIDFGGG
jgi:hypothetical protein